MPIEADALLSSDSVPPVDVYIPTYIVVVKGIVLAEAAGLIDMLRNNVLAVTWYGIARPPAISGLK